MIERVSKEAIEEALRPIVGLPVNFWSRVLDMADIGFGRTVTRQTRRGPQEKSEYALHIQCDWRVVRDGRVLVGYVDFHRPPLGFEGSEDDFKPRDAKRNRQDDLIEAVLAHHEGPHIVQTVEGSSTGDLKVWFDDHCLLETFVWSAQIDGDPDEHWRFFETGADRHFVVVGGGIQGPDA
jgi:hypothetical protein